MGVFRRSVMLGDPRARANKRSYEGINRTFFFKFVRFLFRSKSGNYVKMTFLIFVEVPHSIPLIVPRPVACHPI